MVGCLSTSSRNLCDRRSANPNVQACTEQIHYQRHLGTDRIPCNTDRADANDCVIWSHPPSKSDPEKTLFRPAVPQPFPRLYGPVSTLNRQGALPIQKFV